jgi:hypothetical protein
MHEVQKLHLAQPAGAPLLKKGRKLAQSVHAHLIRVFWAGCQRLCDVSKMAATREERPTKNSKRKAHPKAAKRGSKTCTYKSHAKSSEEKAKGRGEKGNKHGINKDAGNGVFRWIPPGPIELGILPRASCAGRQHHRSREQDGLLEKIN